MPENIYDVYEVRTDKGGSPELALAGRFWLRDGGLVVLEEHSPSGLRALAPPSPYQLIVPIEAPPAKLPPIQRRRPAVFEYKRAGMDAWHVLETDESGMVLDGQKLSQDEGTAILNNLERGLAELRYKEGVPTQPEAVSQKPRPEPADVMRDSWTGLGNLLAFETAQPPILTVTLRAYAALWRKSPQEAMGAVKVLAGIAQQLGGQWFKLECGVLARENTAPDEALRLCQGIVRELRATTLGQAGLGDVLCVASDADHRAGTAQLAAHFLAGSAVLLGDAPVAL